MKKTLLFIMFLFPLGAFAVSGCAGTSGRGQADYFKEQSVRFERGSAEINPVSKVILDNKLEYLKHFPGENIMLVGHADNRGDQAENLTLGRQRAQAVADYFTARGVDKDRISITTMGDRAGKEAGDDDLARAANRRVEFFLGSEPFPY